MRVISAIGILGSKDEVPYLTFLDDRDGSVVMSAMKGIEHLSGENFDWCGKNPCSYEEKIRKVKGWWQAHRSTWK